MKLHRQINHLNRAVPAQPRANSYRPPNKLAVTLRQLFQAQSHQQQQLVLHAHKFLRVDLHEIPRTAAKQHYQINPVLRGTVKKGQTNPFGKYFQEKQNNTHHHNQGYAVKRTDSAFVGKISLVPKNREKGSGLANRFLQPVHHNDSTILDAENRFSRPMTPRDKSRSLPRSSSKRAAKQANQHVHQSNSPLQTKIRQSINGMKLRPDQRNDPNMHQKIDSQFEHIKQQIMLEYFQKHPAAGMDVDLLMREVSRAAEDIIKRHLPRQLPAQTQKQDRLQQQQHPEHQYFTQPQTPSPPHPVQNCSQKTPQFQLHQPQSPTYQDQAIKFSFARRESLQPKPITNQASNPHQSQTQQMPTQVLTVDSQHKLSANNGERIESFSSIGSNEGENNNPANPLDKIRSKSSDSISKELQNIQNCSQHQANANPKASLCRVQQDAKLNGADQSECFEIIQNSNADQQSEITVKYKLRFLECKQPTKEVVRVSPLRYRRRDETVAHLIHTKVIEKQSDSIIIP